MTIEKAEELRQRIMEASTPADPEQAARVRGALQSLEDLKNGAIGLLAAYNAAEGSVKPEVIVDSYDDLISGLITVLDITAGIIHAVVREVPD